jgi:hypothetical protein
LSIHFGDRTLRWVGTYKSSYFWREGNPDQAVALGLDALTTASKHDSLALQVTANLRLGQGCHGWGR